MQRVLVLVPVTQDRQGRPSTPARGSSALLTRPRAAWAAIGASLLRLVLMTIVILQNSARINVHYFGLTISSSDPFTM